MQTVLVVVEIDGILEDLAVERAQTRLAHQREHLRVVGRRLTYVAYVARVCCALRRRFAGTLFVVVRHRLVVAHVVMKVLVECLTRLALVAAAVAVVSRGR